MEESITSKDILTLVLQKFDLSECDANLLSPLVLAYIGDAFYEVIVRSIVVLKGNKQVNKLHKESASMVNAGKQAKIINAIKPSLTEQELSIYKRERNANVNSMAKNSTLSEYRNATGFEALMGYLYLNNEKERAVELVFLGLQDSKGAEEVD